MLKSAIVIVGIMMGMALGGLIYTIHKITSNNDIIPFSKVETIVPQKWIDPDNLNIVYIVPNGYTLMVMPGYITVPEIYSQAILGNYMKIHDGQLPPVRALPDDWITFITPSKDME